MTRVLVIGGTGHVGPWAVAGLRELAPDAGVWTLNRRGLAPEGAAAIRGDRHDPAALRAALETARPDVVVDMIPFRVADAREVVDALRAWGESPRLVAVSSADVYEAFSRLNGLVPGPAVAGPITERSPLREGEGAQGAAYDKLGVERAYAAALPEVAALRLPAVYGAPDTGRVRDWVEAMAAGDEIRMHPELARWRFARVLAANAGWAVALAALRGATGAWNVAEPETPTERGWTARIAAAMGWRGRIVEDPDAEPPGFPCAQDIDLSDARIRAGLGYRERHDTARGLRAAVALARG